MSALAAPAPPAGLTFPAHVFQKLAPSSFLTRHLQASTRPCNRRPDEFRAPSLHTSALSHAHGSAVVRCGDTAVVCGVRGEILPLLNGEGKTKGKVVVTRSDGDDEEDEVSKLNLVVPNIELGTGASKDYHPGPPSDLAQSVAERLNALLVQTTKMVPARTLRIEDADAEVKAYWVLYVDVVCLSLDGNIFDVAWGAIMAALRATRLPLAAWDVDSETVVCERGQDRGLELGMCVFTASFCVLEEGEENWVLADPDEFEESVCEGRVLVAIREDGKVARIEKGGFRSGVAVIQQCVEMARKRYAVWEKLVKESS